MTTGLERARRDLDEGRHRLARERLKSLLVQYPDDTNVRRLLAETYRRDGQASEAGRWGFLDTGAATDRERDAFLRQIGHTPGTSVPPDRMRYLLKHKNPKALADPSAGVLLKEVTRYRPPRVITALLGKLRHRR